MRVPFLVLLALPLLAAAVGLGVEARNDGKDGVVTIKDKNFFVNGRSVPLLGYLWNEQS
jgi:hypothetical protein